MAVLPNTSKSNHGGCPARPVTVRTQSSIQVSSPPQHGSTRVGVGLAARFAAQIGDTNSKQVREAIRSCRCPLIGRIDSVRDHSWENSAVDEQFPEAIGRVRVGKAGRPRVFARIVANYEQPQRYLAVVWAVHRGVITVVADRRKALSPDASVRCYDGL